MRYFSSRQFFIFPLIIGIFCLTFGAKASVFNPKTYTLENGLKIVVVVDKKAPIASLLVLYKVGAIDEPQGKTGMAHLLEHMMFKGTKTLKEGDYTRIVAENGGVLNAFTTTDFTGYYEYISAKKLPKIMKLEADRMVNLNFTQNMLTHERDVVKEERRMRVSSNPQSLLLEQMNATLYLNYPYRRPVVGWPSDLNGITQQDLMHFYKTWYAPNNATLIIAGDVDPQKVYAQAQTYFGALPKNDNLKHKVYAEEKPITQQRITLRHKSVQQPQLIYRWLVPNENQETPTKNLAKDIMSDLLASGKTSYLYQKLVVQDKVATDVGAYHNSIRRGPGIFVIYATPAPKVSIKDLRKKLDEALKAFKAKKADAKDVQSNIQRAQDSAILAHDSILSIPEIIAMSLGGNQSLKQFENWPQAIAKVTPRDVEKAKEKVLTLPPQQIGILLPKANKTPAVKKGQ